MLIRKHVYYEGTVQGVGFRYTTIRVAASYRVAGYVRNMLDGRVEVLVEGSSDQVEVFLDDLASAMGSYIRQVQLQEEVYTGEFDSFRIRY